MTTVLQLSQEIMATRQDQRNNSPPEHVTVVAPSQPAPALSSSPPNLEVIQTIIDSSTRSVRDSLLASTHSTNAVVQSITSAIAQNNARTNEIVNHALQTTSNLVSQSLTSQRQQSEAHFQEVMLLTARMETQQDVANRHIAHTIEHSHQAMLQQQQQFHHAIEASHRQQSETRVEEVKLLTTRMEAQQIEANRQMTYTVENSHHAILQQQHQFHLAAEVTNQSVLNQVVAVSQRPVSSSTELVVAGPPPEHLSDREIYLQILREVLASVAYQQQEFTNVVSTELQLSRALTQHAIELPQSALSYLVESFKQFTPTTPAISPLQITASITEGISQVLSKMPQPIVNLCISNAAAGVLQSNQPLQLEDIPRPQGTIVALPSDASDATTSAPIATGPIVKNPVAREPILLPEPKTKFHTREVTRSRGPMRSQSLPRDDSPDPRGPTDPRSAPRTTVDILDRL